MFPVTMSCDDVTRGVIAANRIAHSIRIDIHIAVVLLTHFDFTCEASRIPVVFVWAELETRACEERFLLYSSEAF